jgi:hypothetical protein
MALQHQIKSGAILFHFVNNSLEAFGVAEGDLGKGLTVQGDLVGLQLVHEHAVGKAVLADCGVDTLDPQGAEVALLDLAAAVGVVVAFSTVFTATVKRFFLRPKFPLAFFSIFLRRARLATLFLLRGILLLVFGLKRTFSDGSLVL